MVGLRSRDFLNNGEILLDGSVEDLVRAYDDQNAIEASKSAVKLSTENLPSDYGHSKGGSGEVKDVKVRLTQVGLDVKENQIGFGDSFEINVNFTLSETQNDLLLRFTIDAAHYSYIASIDTLEQGLDLKTLEAGKYRLTTTLKILISGQVHIKSILVQMCGIPVFICFFG